MVTYMLPWPVRTRSVIPTISWGLGRGVRACGARVAGIPGAASVAVCWPCPGLSTWLSLLPSR